MTEIWRRIPDFSTYEVSKTGKVRSLRTSVHGKPRVMKTRLDKGGYVTISTMYNDAGSVKTTKVHRLVASAFIPNPQHKAHVNHIDGDKLNNCVDNLEWCTHKENFKHATEHWLRPLGEESGRHKLTWDNVDYIREVYVRGSSEFGTNALAKKFNVTPRVITLVIRNEIWNKRRGVKK